MTWQPSNQQLGDAALAGGKQLEFDTQWNEYTDTATGDHWQPHLPTTQGKADLLDLMLAATLSHKDFGNYIEVFRLNSLDVNKLIAVKDGDKHAALARAVIEVASQIGGKMKC